jgi:hypothetical protein
VVWDWVDRKVVAVLWDRLFYKIHLKTHLRKRVCISGVDGLDIDRVIRTMRFTSATAKTKNTMRSLAICLLISATAAALHAQSIADSVRDFSGTQGRNNWYYGFYDASADSAPGYNPIRDFTRFTTFDGSSWYINASATYWTALWGAGASPNGSIDNGGRTRAEHWVVRRWVSTLTGLVRIHGQVAAVQTNGSGDGITVRIFVNGIPKFIRSLPPRDSRGFDYSFGVGLRAGDTVDFALTSGCCGNSTYDMTKFTGIIDPADFVLTSQTSVEVGVPTIPDQRYQVYHSPDLAAWTAVGQPFTGTGEMMYFLFSTRELGSTGYFKAEKLP